MTRSVVSDAWVVTLCATYAATAWLLEMYQVVAPRNWLRERIVDLEARIRAEGHGPDQPTIDNLKSLLKSLARPWLVLPSSRVQAGWRYVHAVEDALILRLPEEQVDEQLRTTKSRLRELGGAEAKDLIARIDGAQDPRPPLAARRALLREASVFRHNVSDGDYEDLANILAKAVLLTVLALVIVTGLAILLGREAYFLFGAAGALFSRLSRVLRGRLTASDYGAAWSTLILTPAGGALAGWLGVLIAAVLAEAPFDVFGDAFSRPWDDALSSLGFVIAFISGFSERWFTKLIGTAEARLTGLLPGGEEGKEPS